MKETTQTVFCDRNTLTKIPLESGGCSASGWRPNWNESTMRTLNRGLNMDLMMMSSWKKVNETVIR
jgi:hypothetical protein